MLAFQGCDLKHLSCLQVRITEIDEICFQVIVFGTEVQAQLVKQALLAQCLDGLVKSRIEPIPVPLPHIVNGIQLVPGSDVGAWLVLLTEEANWQAKQLESF